MQPNFLSKFSFGLGLTALAAKGLLIWSINRSYDFSDASLEKQTPEVIDPANNLVSVMALIGLAGAIVAFAKGARGHMLYASIVLNSVVLLTNPMVYAIY
jgi:hypothetical protein